MGSTKRDTSSQLDKMVKMDNGSAYTVATTLPHEQLGRSAMSNLHTAMPAFFDVFDLTHYDAKRITFKNQSGESVNAVELRLHDMVFILLPACADDIARQLSKHAMPEVF